MFYFLMRPLTFYVNSIFKSFVMIKHYGFRARERKHMINIIFISYHIIWLKLHNVEETLNLFFFETEGSVRKYLRVAAIK